MEFLKVEELPDRKVRELFYSAAARAVLDIWLI
ncbi:conserved hypothetical protein [Agrobacterium fabacearum S56]|nr:conserved hypothetical protein [Agrobacterium fabacearum S56]